MDSPIGRPVPQLLIVIAMRHLHRTSSLLLLAVSSFAATASAAPAAVPDEYVVTLAPSSTALAPARLAAAHRGQVLKQYRRALHGFVARMSADDAAALAREPGVARVEPNVIVRATQVQSGAPWGLDRIDQDSSQLDGNFHTLSGAGVTVYVIDTGLVAHADLAGRIGAGYSAIDDGLDIEDCNGHGTHVAGTIAGSVYGVAKRARIEPVRVLDCDANGSLSSLLDGIDWVLQNHDGGVVNMSLSGPANDTIDAAVSQLVADGLIVVVAAGNENVDACGASPARAPFSNWGACVDLFAPGDEIVSLGITGTTATATLSGTSMAAPHVAGALAAYLAANPNAPATQAKSALLANGGRGKVTDLRGSGDVLLNTRYLVPPSDDVSKPVPSDDTDEPAVEGGCSAGGGAGGLLALLGALGLVARSRRRP